MTTKKTHSTPLSGGEEAYSGMDGLGTQPQYYEMAPLPSAMFKDSKLVRSTAEHTDYDPLLIDVGERDHGQKARGIFRSFMAAHNPITPNGRKQLKRTFLSSGPAAFRYATPTRNEEPGKYSGWRMGLLVSCIAVGVCLLINTMFTIYAVSVDHAPGGIGTLFTGSCDEVKKLDIWIHVCLNILGIALLGASNYTMQCLSSPTRAEIDTAHSKGIWLDIGVPSVRNLRHIGWRKDILWLLLGTFSFPLHCLWNSAIFSTLQANDYIVSVVSPNFLQDTNPNCTGLSVAEDYCDVIGNLYAAARTGTHPQINLTRLEPKDCISAYGTNLQSRWSNVIAVSTNTTPRYFPEYKFGQTNLTINTTLGSSTLQDVLFARPNPDGSGNQMSWLCNADVQNCNLATALTNASHWTISPDSYPYHGPADFPYAEYVIDHCLASSTTETCKLQYSLVIIVIVVCSNAFKLLAMLTTLATIKEDQIITIGDAIASFLKSPDTTTSGACLATKNDFKRKFSRPQYGTGYTTTIRSIEDPRISDLSGGLMQNKERKIQQRWHHAPSRKRLLICITLCSTALIGVAILLYIGINALTDVTSIWSLGFGAIDGRSLIWITQDINSKTPGTLMAMVLLANSPQLVLSSLYFMYNSLYTCMLSATEWSRSARHRKALRVTSPTHAQRSTYWLALPWRYSLPLSMTSSLMHWLISQSIFLARVGVYDPRNEPIQTISTCGYSAYAIVIVIIVGSTMVLALLVNGFRKLDSGMPLVGSCSLAISAACHRPLEDKDAALKPVQWGAVSHETIEGPGHCCFTSFDVEPPILGQRYAGLKED